MKPLQFSPDRSKEAILQSPSPVESTALLTMPGVISIESTRSHGNPFPGLVKTVQLWHVDPGLTRASRI